MRKRNKHAVVGCSVPRFPGLSMCSIQMVVNVNQAVIVGWLRLHNRKVVAMRVGSAGRIGRRQG